MAFGIGKSIKKAVKKVTNEASNAIKNPIVGSIAGTVVGGSIGAGAGLLATDKGRAELNRAYGSVGGLEGIGNIGLAALSGAGTGALAGGLPGAVVGGVVGGAAGTASQIKTTSAEKKAASAQKAYDAAISEENDRAQAQNRANLLSLKKNLNRNTTRATQGGGGATTTSTGSQGGIMLG